MKRITLTLVLLLGGAAVAHANPPGDTPPAAPIAPYGVDAPRADAGWRGPQGTAARGPRTGHGGRAGKHRLPPRVRARLVAMFDRDGDGRLQGPEQRAAKKFVRQLRQQRGQAGARGPRGAGRRAMGPGTMNY